MSGNNAQKDAAEALQESFGKGLGDAAHTTADFHEDTGVKLKTATDEHVETDQTQAENLGQVAKPKVTRIKTTGEEVDVSYHPLSPEDLKSAGITMEDYQDGGIKADGVDEAETGGTDPVDLVSGQLIAATTDVGRQGVLPLLVRRAYASGYAHGGLFGAGWASTLDIRLLLADGQIRFLGDNAQTLDYGTPVGLSLGLPAYPKQGARWPLSRDGEYLRVEDTGSGRAWYFDRGGDGAVRPLREIRDRHGNRISVERDDLGVPIAYAHEAGYAVRIESVFTAEGPRISRLYFVPGGQEAEIALLHYSYDDAGRLVTITDSSAIPYCYEWDEHDRISGWTDRNGHDFHYAYDAEGRVVRTVGEGGYLSSEIAYDVENRVTAVTNGLGHTASYHHDRFGHVDRIVDPLGGELTMENDRYGNVLAVTDALGNSARTERDSDGLPILLIGATGAETTLDYDGFGLPVRIKEPNGAVWSYAYDDTGNLIRRTDPLGAVSSYTYNERGGLTAATDALGRTTRFEVDAAGLPTTVTDPVGRRWGMAYDRFGRITTAIDPLGNTQRWSYSIEGRQLGSENSGGGVMRNTYDAAGNLIEQSDQVGNITRSEYGPMGLRTALVDAQGERHVFTYDSELHLTSVTGPTGLTWALTHDDAGRVVAERDFDGREWTYRRDAGGRLVETVTAGGQSVRYEYDAAGHVTRKIAGDLEYRYTTDATGELVRVEGPGSILEFTRDLLGRAVAENLDGRLLTRTYDAVGRVTGRQTPSGAWAAWEFDSPDGTWALTMSGGRIEFAHDGAGRETSRVLGPAGRLEHSYDAAGRLAAVSLATSRGLVQQRDYRYRGDGAVERIDDLLRGSRPFTLDALGRVTAVLGPALSENYTYDELGNLSSAFVGESGARHLIVGMQIRQAGRASYGYDADGQLISKRIRTISGQLRQWSYQWDALGRLTQVETPDRGSWVYGYDALGRRSSKSSVDATGAILERTQYTYDGARLAEESYADLRVQPAAVITTTWEYEPDSFTPVAQSRSADLDEQFHAIITDLVGTPQELVAIDGTVLWLTTGNLWGRVDEAPHSLQSLCPLRFPGQYFDPETGLHYNLHRYYDPETAAYISPDPLGLFPAPNHRSYVANPLTEFDPTGLNGEGGAKVEGPNLANSRVVEAGTDPMSKLAVKSRLSESGWLKGTRNVAVLLYKDDKGEMRGVAAISDVRHSERLGWDALSSGYGVEAGQVRALYSELQPCTGERMPNCDRYVASNFPNAAVSHSFEYADTRASRIKGIKSLKSYLTGLRNNPTLPY